MRPLEDLRFRWNWRTRRVVISRPRQRGETPAFGYAPSRSGPGPAAVAAIVAVALAAGGWVGLEIGGTGGSPAGDRPSHDPGASAPAVAVRADPARTAIAALSTAREDGRRDLATATSLGEQAAAALGLRRAHLRAASRFDGTHEAIAHALRRDARAYGALARAVEGGDRRAYSRASTAVLAAERDLWRLIGSLR